MLYFLKYLLQKTEKQKLKKLYNGKYFYIISKDRQPKDATLLIGPRDDIYYSINQKTRAIEGFVQIVDRSPYRYFDDNEILVADRIL